LAPNVRTLLPLDEPTAPGWDLAAALGAGAVVVAHLATPKSAATPELTSGLRALTDAGVTVLGYADLGFGTRSITGLMPRFAAWAALGATGIFLDQVPAGPFHLGGVRLAHRLARIAGLTDVVFNPGRPVDPLCRRLVGTFCTFHGSWSEYQAWDGTDAEEGDGHLVYDVPPEFRREAHDLIRTRGAGLALISEYAWPPSAAAVAAGIADSSTTSGS
jgi:Spherulation-specific family 4